MTVGKKLMINIGVTLAALFGQGAADWYSNQTMGHELSDALRIKGQRALLCGELSSELADLRLTQRGMMLYAMAHDSKRVHSNREEFQDHLRKAKAEVAGIRPLITAAKGTELLNSIEADMNSYAGSFEQMASAISAGKVPAAMAIASGPAAMAGQRMETASREYISFQKSQLEDADHAAAEKAAAARWIILAFLAIGLAVQGANFLVSRRITAQLRTVVASLSDGASQIAAGSGQVSTASQSLAQGASEQAASLEETSASAEEITSMTRQNASNTGQVAQLMTTVDQRVADGNSTLGLMIASMKQINASSDKISRIIKVIDEIAFQTNILALNAAVEAARAGQAGAGFAVVADEVRNLAQRSAQAAKDTAALIEESIATSHEGSAQLQKVVDVVGSITEAAAEVKVLVDEVSIGSQEQAKGMEEIARALTEIDKVTQGTAAAAEESASASEEMSAQAQSLSQIVGQLKSMAG